MFATLCLLAVSTGCEYDCYQVEITPEGDAFQRRLTCWHVGAAKEGEGAEPTVKPIAKEQLDRLGKLYPKRETPDGEKKHTFVGRFSGQTPSDVGGAGSITHFDSPLGTLSAYVERFRGNDDLQSQLAARRQAVDRLTDLLSGWLEMELAGEPGFAKLKKFVDGDLRADLMNLTVYEWTGRAVGSYKPDMHGEFLFRAGQYLCERKYLSPGDVPALARSMTAGDPAPVLKHLRRLVADKLGKAADRPDDKALAFLSDSKLAEASWCKYVESTDMFKQRIRQWKENKKTEPDAEKPTPNDVADELVDEMMSGMFFPGAADQLEVKLNCPREPFATNGKWDPDADSVQWKERLDKSRAVPVFCFACWSCPNPAKQKRHFGRVVLEGDDLATYVIWYNGLSRTETGEWDRFVAGCRPGAGLKPRLEAFRFAADPKPDPAKPDEKPGSLADTPRDLILAALKPEEK